MSQHGTGEIGMKIPTGIKSFPERMRESIKLREKFKLGQISKQEHDRLLEELLSSAGDQRQQSMDFENNGN